MQRSEGSTRTTVLSTQKTPDKIKPSKQILAKFSYPLKSQNRKFQSPPKYFDHPCHSKSVVPLGFEQAWPHTINDGSALDPIGRSPFLLL